MKTNKLDIIKRKKLNVYAVDIFTGTKSEGHIEPNYKQEFINNLKRFDIFSHSYIFEGTTDDATNYIKGNLDLVFIDADHEYDAVKNDIEKWLSKLKEHGTISGHDYGNHIGVSKAINERWSNIRLGNSVWSKRI